MKDNIFDTLELFKDEIPKINKLAVEIRQMLSNSKYDLTDIREYICDHILDFIENHDDDEKLSEVVSVSYNVIDNLIDVLEESATNCNRIKDYISYYESYNGYNRLITDFNSLLTETERVRLINKGKMLFGSDITEHWD